MCVLVFRSDWISPFDSMDVAVIVKSMYDLVDFIYSENIFILAEVCKFEVLVVHCCFATFNPNSI